MQLHAAIMLSALFITQSFVVYTLLPQETCQRPFEESFEKSTTHTLLPFLEVVRKRLENIHFLVVHPI